MGNSILNASMEVAGFPFRLRPPRLIAEEVAAEEAAKSKPAAPPQPAASQPQSAAAPKPPAAPQPQSATAPNPQPLPNKYRQSTRIPLTPLGAIAGQPSQRPAVQLVPNQGLSVNLWGGRLYIGAPEPLISPEQQFDENYRATYHCEHDRNCSVPVRLLEYRFPLP